MEGGNNQSIIMANKNHIKQISSFQIEMAQETQGLTLNPKSVNEALTYFLKDTQQNQKNAGVGFILIKQINQKPIGSLMITYQSKKQWWILSASIIKQERKKGYFGELFRDVLRRGKEEGVEKVKLYVETQNVNARKIYQKLGMKYIKNKFYAYDFIFGKPIVRDPQEIQIKILDNDNKMLISNIPNKNLLNSHFSETPFDYKPYLILINNKPIGYLTSFDEFCEWRFGTTKYIRQLYLIQEQTEKMQDCIMKFIVHMREISEIKVGAVRVIFEGEEVAKKLDGGRVESYEVLEIDL